MIASHSVNTLVVYPVSNYCYTVIRSDNRQANANFATDANTGNHRISDKAGSDMRDEMLPMSPTARVDPNNNNNTLITNWRVVGIERQCREVGLGIITPV